MADGKNNWKHDKYVPMQLVLCSDGTYRWGNPSKKGVYRCTKCGKEHG